MSAVSKPSHTSPEWINKAEAAERLGRSVRTVLQMAADGEIKSQKIKDPDTSQTVVQLHAGDIERILYEREHPEPVSTTAVAVVKPAAVQKSEASQPLQATAHLRPWLTLEETVEFSGLTRRWLLDDARRHTPTVPVRDMGYGSRGGRWRFHRASLEKA